MGLFHQAYNAWACYFAGPNYPIQKFINVGVILKYAICRLAHKKISLKGSTVLSFTLWERTLSVMISTHYKLFEAKVWALREQGQGL